MEIHFPCENLNCGARPKKKWQTWPLDLLILAFVLGLIALSAYGVIPPCPYSGIYCNDASINFKFQGDTVPTRYLFLGIFLPPILVIFLTELIHISCRVSPSVDGHNNHQVGLGQSNAKLAWKVTKSYSSILASGILFSALLNEMLKSLVAEPRPHFMETCQPINLNCTDKNEFVPYWRIECSQNNTARNGVPRAVSDAMKSFPSGHAQLSTFAAVFMVIYIQRRIQTSYSHLWKHLLAMAFIFFALLCSMSRISDKRHHWWDVLAGVIIGAISGYIAAVWQAQNFNLKPYDEMSESEGTSSSNTENTAEYVSYTHHQAEEANLRQRSSTTAATN